MQFSTTFVALLSTISSATAFSIFRGDEQSVIIQDDLKIPGDSPLELCPTDHANDLIEIKKVDLEPNPPVPGNTLVIKAVGTVFEDIEEGAYVLLQVKYGLIRLISTKADLCEQVKNVELECPIEKGLIAITKSVELPKEIPPGKYNVIADVFTKDDRPITCLTAHVTFGKYSVGEL